jgi:hypothetical protein
MEGEQIIVRGPASAQIIVETSDASTQLTVDQKVVDLNGGWDDGPDGKLTSIDDYYRLSLEGGAGND